MARPTARARQPIALTIAGSDSGGGAGIQADLRTFAALGVHGTTAITCVTAQNPVGVTAAHAIPPEIVTSQLAALWAELPPAAVKTGMLFNAGIIQAVAKFWVSQKSASPARLQRPLIVDPVMIATSGASLLEPNAVDDLENRLLPHATLLTPNLDELAALLRRPVGDFTTVDDLRRGARELRSKFGCAVLAKGGHLRDGTDAVDIFWDGREELGLVATRIRGLKTHGTGCTYAAAITGYLALGCPLAYAVQLAKTHLTRSLEQSVRLGTKGKHTSLNPFWT